MGGNRLRPGLIVVSALVLLGVSLGPGGCGTAPGDALASFADELQAKGIVVVEYGVMEDEETDRPQPGVYITVQADGDGEAAMELVGQVWHEASLAKGRGEFFVGWMKVTALDSTGKAAAGNEGALVAAHDATPADGITDQEAADIVRQYFATTAPDRMQGVAIEDLQVTTEMGQRTLRLDLLSDGSDEADGSLSWLCFGATSEESWTGDLNDDWGVGLVWVHIYTTYPWGLSEHSVVDIAGRSLTTYGGAPHWRGGPPTTAPGVGSAAPTSTPTS